ncbi:MAG: hypothetical protein ACTSUE_08630 [Promethearchaeota archaeon]
MAKIRILNDLLIPSVLMGSFGLFYWAIRGTGGYGGSMGGVFAGLGYAICWYFLSNNRKGTTGKPYGSGWTVLAITLGIAIGGFHGYGQFNSWIWGIFQDGSGMTYPINPLWGFLSHFQCGLCWGGMTGVMLGWTRTRKKTVPSDWYLRFAFGIAGALVGWAIFIAFPQILVPAFNQVPDYYDFVACPQCERALLTARSSIILFGIFAGLLAYEMYKKDWRNVMLAVVIGLGFALSFSIGALWFFSPHPWLGWKTWEMTIGCGAGVTFGFAYYLFNKKMDPLESRRVKESSIKPGEVITGVNVTIFLALALIVYNGLNGSGLWDNYFTDELVGPELSSLMATVLLAITGVVSSIFLILCLVSSFNHKKRLVRDPDLSGAGSIFSNPSVKFLIIQVILASIGMVISLSPDMFSSPFNVLSPPTYNVVLYMVFLGIGFTMYGVSFKLDREKKFW